MCFPRYTKLLPGLFLVTAVAGALLCLTVPPGQGQTTASKQSVPDPAAVKSALEKLQAQHKDAYARAKTDPKARLDLANTLIKQASGKPAADQYAHWQEAARLAADAGDLGTAYWAVEELAETFKVDVLPLKADAVKASVSAAKTPEASAEVVEQALKLVEAAVGRDQYELAAALGQSAEEAARKTKDLPLVLSVQRERKWITATQEKFLAIKPFLDRLAKDSTDAEANLQVGKYLCLLKGDWEEGLYLLAQSNDADLRLQAQRDLINPDATKEQIEVGDAWWVLADRHQGQTRVHIRQRAVHWYQQAIYATDGTVQEKLEERIALVPVSTKHGVPWDYSGPPGQIQVVGNQFGNIFAVAFSPDGKLIASGGSDTQAVIWDIKSGKKLQTLMGHTSTVWGVAFDPKGKHVFTTGWDGTARMWEVQTGKLVQRFPPAGQFGSMYGLAVSPDGRQLLTGTSDGAVRLWDIKTGKLVHALNGHKGPVYGVTFFAGGKKALTCGSFDRQLIVWDLDKGKDLTRINNPGTSGRYVAVTPDGTKAVASGENVVRLWDLRTGQEIRQFKGHTSLVYTVAFSPNGKRLITGSLDATIRYWDVATGKQLHEPFKGHNSTVYALDFSPGGGRIVSGGLDNTIRLWGLPR